MYIHNLWIFAIDFSTNCDYFGGRLCRVARDRQSETGMEPGPGRSNTSKDGHLRRYAIQIAAQLPENIDDARRVISLLQELTESFLAPQTQRPRQFSVLDGGGQRPAATDG